MSDLDLATIEARAAARPLRDNDGHEDFEALLAEVKRLRDRLSSWDNAVEHVTKGGKSARSVSSSEGWTLCHAEFHSDLMCEVERLTAEHAHLTSFVNKGLDEEKRLAAEVERLKAHIWNTGIDDLEARLSLAEGRRNEAQTEVERLKKEERNAFFTAAELGRVMGRLRAAGIGAEWVVGEMLHKVAPHEGVEVLVTERDAALATAARLREAAERVLRLEHGTTTTTGDYEEYLRYQADKAKAWADLRAALTDSEPVAKWLAEHDAKVREEARVEMPRRQTGSPEGGGSIPPTAPTEPTCDCIGQFGGHDPRCATVQKPPTEPTCATCGQPATCIGRYEDMAEDEPACDDCCGHGNEDGRCEPITCTRCGGKGDDPEHAGACGDCAGTGSKP